MEKYLWTYFNKKLTRFLYTIKKYIRGRQYTVDPWVIQGLGYQPSMQKSTYNFWLPQSLTMNSLLLKGSLTNYISSWLTNIFYVICITYYTLTIEKKVFFQIVANFHFSNVFIEKHLCKWTRAVLKPVLFKGQWYTYFLKVWDFRNW